MKQTLRVKRRTKLLLVLFALQRVFPARIQRSICVDACGGSTFQTLVSGREYLKSNKAPNAAARANLTDWPVTRKGRSLLSAAIKMGLLLHYTERAEHYRQRRVSSRHLVLGYAGKRPPLSEGRTRMPIPVAFAFVLKTHYPSNRNFGITPEHLCKQAS